MSDIDTLDEDAARLELERIANEMAAHDIAYYQMTHPLFQMPTMMLYVHVMNR